MIFAVATDDKGLMVFADIADLTAYCECVDVEDGGWKFWDEAGVALVHDILTPSHRGRSVIGSGAYRLVIAPHLGSLSDSLATIESLERNAYFSTVAEVRAYLANVASLQQHGT